MFPKGYRLLVTDKNHSRVTFGYNDLETQLRRLEQFLVYCDDSKQELATLNLLVQRNIPVTFAPRPVAVINDTIEPAVGTANSEGDPGASFGDEPSSRLWKAGDCVATAQGTHQFKTTPQGNSHSASRERINTKWQAII